MKKGFDRRRFSRNDDNRRGCMKISSGRLRGMVGEGLICAYRVICEKESRFDINVVAR